jgi:hypothetical protein
VADWPPEWRRASCRTGTEDQGAEALALRVRVALDSADLGQFAELLDPKVRWGAPDDPNPSCQSRRDLLAWYRQGRAAGTHGRVGDVEGYGDKILIHMVIAATSAADGAPVQSDRRQVLTCAHVRVVNIRGFETRDEALARLDSG